MLTAYLANRCVKCCSENLKISGVGGTENLLANKTEPAVNRNGLYGKERKTVQMSEISTTLRAGQTELTLCVCVCTDMCRLTTGILSDKCVVRRFRCYANVIGCT